MPLVRVEVRNEYGLGMPELYTEADREDPKAVLDGVAVAGLVGLLRQLGDLAEFAAEVFHGLQEQVLITSSRSHKLVERVHTVESALPQLEKAILGQRSHLHFAYTAGSKWHTRLGIAQNHFIYSDLPCCIMDSYDGCNDPPRLHNLDKFDIGGPGSCFKRYSDPTYFKRSSAGLYEGHFQSIPREKKKRRSLSRYKDMTNGAPVLMHGERTDFRSSNFKEKASPSQDLSVQMPQELGIVPEVDHLTSSESRNRSTYTECNFHPSHSTQSEDNNVKELSAVSRVNQDSYLDSASIDENFDNIYLAEDSLSKSAYITWDEKLEIINSTGRPKEPIVMPCTTEKMMDTEVIEGLNSRAVDHIEFDFHDELPRRTPVIIRGQHDEIESETDHYMDALNTVESESEIDLDCHTKRELKQNSNVNNKNMDEMNRESHLDGNSMNSEFHALNSTSLSPKLISHESRIKANGSSNIENHGDAMKSDLIGSNEVAGLSSISLSTPEKLESEEVERSVANIETVTSFIEPNSQPLLREPVSTYESPKPSWSTSGAQTTVSNLVMFWTNGGLLGLEPSKPPDFGLSAVAGPDPVEESKTNELQHPGQQKTINDIKSEASGKLPGISGLILAHDHDGNASSKTTPGTKLVVPKDDSNNSSSMFEFKNRLLANGFRKQISLVGNERLANSVKSDVPVNTSIQKGHQTVTGMPFREQFGNGTSFFSPSSPPLEHMRISFQPIDGFETTKLKLAFPDGNNNSNNNNGSNGLMFPSFQLVPEPANLLHKFASGSDDDDDTFCRSSPYASDDCHSNPSESNSEQWDSSDSPRIKDHELDDAFGRTSSAESVSNSIVKGTSFQQGYLDHKNYGHQSSFIENDNIPNFDSMQASQKLVTNDLKQPPPPMPPIEWRGIKPNPCVTMDKEDGLSEALTYALNLTPPEPTTPQPFKPAAKQDYVAVTDSLTLKHKQPDWENLHVENGSNHTRNGKVGEEKGDFLQQIRTKSRNLRHVSTAQPTMPAGHTSFKVAAILDKAGTIRKAVGSDDGDDNWSDT